MRLQRGKCAVRVRKLALTLLIAGLLVPGWATPPPSSAHEAALAPRAGDGNHVVLGTEESGLWLEVTATGMELGGVSYEGYGRHSSSGFLTARTVTVQGTAHNVLRSTNVTLPSMRASLGTDYTCENIEKRTWPPPDMLDVNGLVGGPYEAEMPFSFSYEVQPGNDRVCFVVQTGMNGGQYEGISITGTGWVGEDFWATPGPTLTPTPTATPVPTPLPPSEKPNFPCDIPLPFYTDQDFANFYTGAPTLNYDRDGLVRDMLNGVNRYLEDPETPIREDGSKILNDGINDLDTYAVASTFQSKTTLPGFQGRGAALQEAAREFASQKQATDPNYRMSPGDLLQLSLKLNDGNLRDALITCHGATYRQQKSTSNKKFVEQEGILAPLRNQQGYASTDWTWKTQTGKEKSLNPYREIGTDQQGVWYHLFGLAALEYVDGKGKASFFAADVVLALKDQLGEDKTYSAMLEKLRKNDYPRSGLGGPLGDLAIALEEAKRSVEENRPPDVDKQCINYWALKVGAELRRLVSEKTPKKLRVKEGRIVGSDASGEETDIGMHVNKKCPLSLRVDGMNGEWFAYDEATREFDGNTPWVLFESFPEEDGTTGLIVQPLFKVALMQLTATGSGPALVATYDPKTGRAEDYELILQPGDQFVVSGEGGQALLNGVALSPVLSTKVSKPSPLGPAAAGAGLLAAALGAVVLVRRSHRRGKVERLPTPVAVAQPLPAAPAERRVCPACSSPLKPGIKFCGSCGAAVPQEPPACPGCGQPAPPGVRFCGNCGSPLAHMRADPPPPVDSVPAVSPVVQAEPERVHVAPPAAQPGESIMAVVPTLSLRKGPLNFWEYNLIVTQRRLVLARVTTKTISDAAAGAKQAVRDQGKGFMHQWAASAGARQYICDRYREMELESILAQDPDSFSLPLQQVREIRSGSDTDADDNTSEWLEIRTSTSRLRFGLQGGAEESARRALKTVLGDMVR
ncbi:MAG TPA: zinc ribbon domain-containing protein [Anaerolineae bacterium]|nr:zinc ribbon domain-containing protein [Anaerolineae bacterium]